jgi:hypothetical protein
VPLLELIVRNIARYPQSATSMPIRYQPAIRYLLPWSLVMDIILSSLNMFIILILKLTSFLLISINFSIVLVFIKKKTRLG